MKLKFSFSSLFSVCTLFIYHAGHLYGEDSSSLFQRYFAICQQKNTENQPVHLHNACRQKDPFFTELTILDVHSPTNIETLAEGILYGDADVVHLGNISTQKAAHLYELLQHTYSHFIHVPSKGQGKLIASKYPLSQMEVRQFDQENAPLKEILEFSIHGANVHKAHICSQDVSIQLMSSHNVEKIDLLLDDLPATLTVVEQQFFPLQGAQKVDSIAEDTFSIVPIRRGESDDRSGSYCEGRIDFKTGPNGTEWSVSGRAGYEDEHGNYIEGEVSRNDKGETSGSAKAGYDKD